MGVNLGPVDLALNLLDSSDTMSSTAGGTQVTFNGTPGPVFYAWSGIVTAIVPYSVASDVEVRVKVIHNGIASPETVLPVAPAAPGIFSADSSGSGPGAILNADYSLNTPDNPAEAGSFVVLYGTGGGMTTTPVADGILTEAATPLAVTRRLP